MDDYLDIEVLMADLGEASGLLPVRVLPSVTVAQLVNAIAHELRSELNAALGDARAQNSVYSLWWQHGVNALPGTFTLDQLAVRRLSRFMFGSDAPVIPRRPFTTERMGQIAADAPRDNDEGVALVIRDNGERLDWHNTPILLGRSGEQAARFRRIELDRWEGARYVSKEHALIFRRDVHYYLVDLGTSNGTYLNGEQLTPKTRAYPLQHNDLILLGNPNQHIALIFERI